MNERKSVGTSVAWHPRARRRWPAAVGAIAFLTFAADAHHSISAVYDGARQQQIQGVVAEFQFVNPHPFLLLAVTDGAGKTQQWRLEMDNRNELVEVGVTRDTLKPGDRVAASGNPARTQPQSLYLRRLDRPSDGFWYEQLGMSPSIGNSSLSPKS